MPKGAQSVSEIRKAGRHKQLESPQLWTNVHHLVLLVVMMVMLMLILVLLMVMMRLSTEEEGDSFFVRGGGSNRVIGPRTGIDKALQIRKKKEFSACHIISFEHEQSCSSERYICNCSCQTFQGPCCQGSELFPMWRAFISCFKAEYVWSAWPLLVQAAFSLYHTDNRTSLGFVINWEGRVLRNRRLIWG